MSESDSAKQAAVTWIHEQMEHHGLTFDDLVEAGCFADIEAADVDAHEEGEGAGEVKPDAAGGDKPAVRPTPLYRNAMGQTWDGTGEYPDWLQRAVNAGQSIDFYRVD
ncbi:H-NS family nucleoid-associated regulatory protein [Cupriavidus plantarum]|uniref:H-NS family nucleoid-associated regulatory protein n=1 Tax=Cupriavidus plantarum TaxID=942865 RepID=UPI00339D87B7